MNILDLIIIIVIVTTAIRAYHRGMVYTIFQTVSNILVLVLSHFVYKPINTILHSMGLYKVLTNMTTNMFFEEATPLGLYEQTKWIEGLKLPIPEMIKEGIIKNNNPEIYKLLGAQNLKEYIAGYLADFCLGVISFIIACIVIKIGMYMVGKTIGIVRKLPIIRVADRWLGLGVGGLKGVLIVWVGITILTFLMIFPSFKFIWGVLDTSSVAKWFYENNIILRVIDQIFV